jgi:hypothetical protein
MFTKCTNPRCDNRFDYREGQLVRFSTPPSNNPSFANEDRIEHFWLCGSCSVLYVLAHESGNIQIKPRVEESSKKRVRSFAAVA